MRSFPRPLLLFLLLPMVACQAPEKSVPDQPRLTPAVRLIDIEIDSTILQRKIPVRLIVPATPAPNAPVAYLLHGAGGSFREWSNHSDIAALAASNVILVMPDSADSYYINDARGFRYEDFFFSELIPRIHKQLPYASRDRSRTAVVGISRGGFGASVYGLHHPELFSFVGGLSSAFNLAERPFRWRAPFESLEYRRVFGSPGSPTRTANDPFLLVESHHPSVAPVFYLTCGDHEVLEPINQNFALILRLHFYAYSFQRLHGDHNWSQWAPQIPALRTALLTHFGLLATEPAP
jgi:putative tributyrin esterase